MYQLLISAFALSPACLCSSIPALALVIFTTITITPTIMNVVLIVVLAAVVHVVLEAEEALSATPASSRTARVESDAVRVEAHGNGSRAGRALPGVAEHERGHVVAAANGEEEIGILEDKDVDAVVGSRKRNALLKQLEHALPRLQVVVAVQAFDVQQRSKAVQHGLVLKFLLVKQPKQEQQQRVATRKCTVSSLVVPLFVCRQKSKAREHTVRGTGTAVGLAWLVLQQQK